jgi:1-acyl-sn-glycerol-3-phosphate acyltransferase
MTTRLGASARRVLWRVTWALAGGLRIHGRPPMGPAVVVANHSSHADSAALLAALPARGRPVFAAGADYWFDVPWRRVLVRSLAAAVPVRRQTGGGYRALLSTAAPRLARGDVVIVYPEGTRAVGGSIGEFRTGALRLTRDLDVPLVPVALVGTANVRPKHGRFSPQGAEIRFGTAVSSRELEHLEAADLRSVSSTCTTRRAHGRIRRPGSSWPAESAPAAHWRWHSRGVSRRH